MKEVFFRLCLINYRDNYVICSIAIKFLSLKISYKIWSFKKKLRSFSITKARAINNWRECSLEEISQTQLKNNLKSGSYSITAKYLILNKAMQQHHRHIYLCYRIQRSDQAVTNKKMIKIERRDKGIKT